MQTWLDRVTMPLAPRWTLRRMRARVAADVLQRHFEAASVGRRTTGWNRGAGDANAAVAGSLAHLRAVARDLERNNAWARSALRTITNRVVGWGIMPDTEGLPAPLRARWSAWAETTACDADGRHNLAGLEKLVTRMASRDGEALVRRRWRTMQDVNAGLPIPMQLQVLEPDHLDTMRDGISTSAGGRIIQGVEFDAIGRRAGYWLLPEHPGSGFVGARTGGESVRIPAEGVLHVFPAERAGQVRGPSQFAASILPLKDLDDYEDAALLKQKIAACLAVILTDVDGASAPLGSADSLGGQHIDTIEPGMIANFPAGRQATVIDPPSVSEHGPYTSSILRKIAAGLPGVGYEDLTGDWSQVNFSSARMARLRAWDDVEDWRWLMLVPQFCDPVWRWFIQALAILEEVPRGLQVEWTAPPMAMIEPNLEGQAYNRNIRNGLITWPEAIRERGYNPTTQLRQIAEWNQKFDDAGVILDSDPRKTNQNGQPRETQAAPKPTPAEAAGTDEERELYHANGHAHGHRSAR